MIDAELPEILDLPDKLLPMILKVKIFRYFLAEGGRGSGKSQAVGRIILFLCEQSKLRVVCGRETQNSIEESVYTVLVDLIAQYDLNFEIQKAKLTHRETGSEIRFKGFREQGVINIKGLEGVDILWIEEAQGISKATLDVIIPTIRKEGSKIFFTMNRFLRTDAVYEFAAGREECLHININFDDNKFCPSVLKKEAEECRRKNEKDYKHIWLGQPLDNAVQYLFNFKKLDLLSKLSPFGDLFKEQSVMSLDFAAGGGDLCVASRLVRLSNVHWGLKDQVAWDDPDTDVSTGKSLSLYGEWQPDILICDAGGLGYPIFCNLSKTIKNIIGFDGAKTDKITGQAANNRAEMYLQTKEFIDQCWLICKSQLTIKQFETIKKVFQRNGSILMQSKPDMRKEKIDSPDRADSVAMAIFAIVHYLGKVDFSTADQPIGMRVQRVNQRKSR